MPNLATLLHEADVIVEALDSNSTMEKLELNGIRLGRVVEVLRDLKERCYGAQRTLELGELS
jgi:hypothetical protein